MTTKQPVAKHRLKLRALDEVSLVPAGDNGPAHVTISKEAPPETPLERAARIIEQRSATDDGAGGTVDVQKEVHNVPDTDIINKDDLDPEVREYIEDLEDVLGLVLDGDVSKDGDDDDTDEDEDTDETPEGQEGKSTVKKSAGSDQQDVAAIIAKADPAVGSLISKMMEDHEALMTRVTDAERIAKEERAIRTSAEVQTVAKSLGSLTASEADLTSVISKMRELDPETAARVETLLAAANTQVEKSALFQEIGGIGKAGDEVIAKAEKLRSDAKTELTAEQAITEVYSSDPELYAAYLRGETV